MELELLEVLERELLHDLVVFERRAEDQGAHELPPAQLVGHFEDVVVQYLGIFEHLGYPQELLRSIPLWL